MAVIKNIHNFCMIFFFFFTFMKPINSHRKNPQKISLCTKKSNREKKSLVSTLEDFHVEFVWRIMELEIGKSTEEKNQKKTV